MPPTSYGIPGGGLFNDIYAAHRAAGRVEYVTVEESEAESPLFVGSSPTPPQPLRRRPVERTRIEYDTVAIDKDPDYDGLTVIGHTLAAIGIGIAYILFVVGPIGDAMKPSLIPALLLLLSPFVVFGLSLKWLKNRWIKKNTSGSVSYIQVPREETYTDWVDDPPAYGPRAGVDAEYARRKARRARGGRTMYPSLYTGRGLVDGDRLAEEMRQLHEHMVSTGNVPQWADRDTAGFELFYGAACEITTARSLRQIAGATVSNDIILRGNDGDVSANIDHLVYGASMVMVDAKWWSSAPTFLPDSRGGLIVPERSPHKRAVSTCIYESTFLPARPRAIVFSVRGRSADQLGGPKVVSSYHKFVPYEEYSQGVNPVPCPVIFTPHDKVRAVVESVIRGGGEVDGTYIPAGHNYPVDSRILRGLETTTELDFQAQ